MAYNESFKFLEKRYGKEAVTDFWIGISDNYLKNLRELVAEKGIQGMKEYWGPTLTEEGGDHKASATDDGFIIDMYECPSVGIVRRNRHIRKYSEYCRHCDVLFPRIIEEYGFTCDVDHINRNLGKCRFRVKKRQS